MGADKKYDMMVTNAEDEPVDKFEYKGNKNGANFEDDESTQTKKQRSRLGPNQISN